MSHGNANEWKLIVRFYFTYEFYVRVFGVQVCFKQRDVGWAIENYERVVDIMSVKNWFKLLGAFI